MDRLKIFNAKIITPYRIINDGSLVVENGKISAVQEGNLEASDCIEINAKGNYVSPGFIDMHTHGGGGHDFMDGTAEAYLGAAEAHAHRGTTLLLPTTLTGPDEELKDTIKVFRKAKQQNTKGAAMLGLHLEGPYFSMEQRGA